MRNHHRIVWCALCIGLALGPGVTTVLGEATSNSQATMDWPVSITGDIAWTSRESLSHAFAANNMTSDVEEDILPGWGTMTDASASVIMASGYAETTSNRLFEEVSAAFDAATVSEAFADAGARRQGYFTANSSGYVTVTAYYAIEQMLTTDMPGDIAEGHSTAQLRLGNESGWDVEYDSLDNTVMDGQDYVGGHDGWLTVELWFDAGEIGFLENEVTNMAFAVPEPSCLLIMGAGLSMIMLRRRR